MLNKYIPQNLQIAIGCFSFSIGSSILLVQFDAAPADLMYALIAVCVTALIGFGTAEMIQRYQRNHAEIKRLSTPSYAPSLTPPSGVVNVNDFLAGQVMPTSIEPAAVQQIDRSHLTPEGEHIDEQLEKYGLGFYVVSVSGSPDHYIYMLEDTGQHATSKLRSFTEDFENGVFDFRGGKGSTPKVTITTAPLAIRVTRPEPVPLPWSANRANRGPLKVALGAYWASEQESVIVDFAHNNFAVGAFYGGQGSGKSVLLEVALVGLLRSAGVDKFEVYGIDQKSDVFSHYASLPQVKFAGSTDADAMNILRYVARLCEAEHNPNDGRYRFLLIDECQTLLEESDRAEEFQGLLKLILRRGRGLGIRVIMATQIPDRNALPPAFKGLVHYQAGGKTRNASYLANQLGLKGCNKIKNAGEFVSDWLDGRTFRAFNLEESDRFAEIKMLEKAYGTDDNMMVFQPRVHRQPRTLIERPSAPPVHVAPPMEGTADAQLMADVEAIEHLFPDSWDFAKGKIKRGKMTPLCDIIHGPGKSTGGYRKRPIAAAEYIIETQHNI